MVVWWRCIARNDCSASESCVGGSTTLPAINQAPHFWTTLICETGAWGNYKKRRAWIEGKTATWSRYIKVKSLEQLQLWVMVGWDSLCQVIWLASLSLSAHTSKGVVTITSCPLCGVRRQSEKIENKWNWNEAFFNGAAWCGLRPICLNSFPEPPRVCDSVFPHFRVKIEDVKRM